jgi:hypothetical protein
MKGAKITGIVALVVSAAVSGYETNKYMYGYGKADCVYTRTTQYTNPNVTTGSATIEQLVVSGKCDYNKISTQ